ncbi:threonine/serine ThrE exporter family protein [Aeromicrobium sp. CF3.5]|uniref:threonine/serine ThrE exporter family protein n=1 Tax=Aeromicrobium sp. CF3.5 TaxID=3373078 RepID=UPI003EE8012D
MSDSHTYQTLDLSLRIGENLLSNGAGAADVAATMSAVAHHLGVRQAHVDLTFTSLRMSHQAGPDSPSATATRHVTRRSTDYDDLTQVDHLVRDLLDDAIDLDGARSRIAQISSTGHRAPRWAVSLAWGVLGAGIALLLGGSPLVALIAAAAAAGAQAVGRLLSRFRLPDFYLQIAGGGFVSMLAVVTKAAEVPVDPSLVIVTGIVTLLAGLGFIGAFQDALSGYYVTANARILEVLLSTVGIVAGVGGGLALGSLFGITITTAATTTELASLPVAAAGGALASAAFALAAYAPTRSALPIAVVGGLAALIYVALSSPGSTPAWPSGVAATFVGLVGYSVARRVRVPPLVIVVPSIAPLLPGLSIYRGLSLLADDNFIGIISLIAAVASAVALASGVILGEYIAQPLGREARRLEQRLSGPRLVGPLRTRKRRDK